MILNHRRTMSLISYEIENAALVEWRADPHFRGL